VRIEMNNTLPYISLSFNETNSCKTKRTDEAN